MSIISKCHYCLPEVNEKRTYRKQTEVYDSIGIDVPMCWNCGEAALFERERIIKLLEDEQYHAIVTEPVEIGSGNEPTTSHWATCEACRFIALIKGENK